MSQLEGRQYLLKEYTLADIAHAGNFHRLWVRVKSSEIPLRKYLNVMVSSPEVILLVYSPSASE